MCFSKFCYINLHYLNSKGACFQNVSTLPTFWGCVFFKILQHYLHYLHSEGVCFQNFATLLTLPTLHTYIVYITWTLSETFFQNFSTSYLHSLMKNSRYAMTADNNITYITYITIILEVSIFEIFQHYLHYLHSEGASVKDFATLLNV